MDGVEEYIAKCKPNSIINNKNVNNYVTQFLTDVNLVVYFYI